MDISRGIREKVGRLFVVRPESLDPALSWTSDAELPAYGLSAVNGRMRSFASDYPAGGVLLYGHNIKDPEQLRAFTKDLKSMPGTPFLFIDEEGGRVSRISRNPAFDVPAYASTASLKDTDTAFRAGKAIGSYLKGYGFDVDFAPVADVNTNPENIIIGDRAFSDDPAKAAPMVAAWLKGLQDAGITGCIKHFPGHGDTREDTHTGFAASAKTWEEMASCEMQTFRAGIAAGARMVMTAHIAAPAVTGSDLPATMSPEILKKLREELHFDGGIITDALEMRAVSDRFGSGEAAVRAFKAGADLLLNPADYKAAFEAVLEAVESGAIAEEEIDARMARRQRIHG
jgi:beta-N-acetylhexosaminidase